MTRTQINAKVILDSVSPTGARLTTIECEYPRYILPEVLTHRDFSRNTSSSRAIPTAKLIKRVREDPAGPVEWGRNQPGMQAGEQLLEGDRLWAASHWRESSRLAALQAELLLSRGVHKQVVNRLLEPFMWVKQIISATEWDNFFAQRVHPDAQPEMRVLAEAIKEARNTSTPQHIGPGIWHTPYVGRREVNALSEGGHGTAGFNLLAISVARCARVSYMTHDGVRDISEDLRLYDRLAEGQHFSPMEHVAAPTPLVHDTSACANFRGWSQFRHTEIVTESGKIQL